MKIDCISDLHGSYPKLDGGDLLIIAGDLTATDTAWEYIEFGIWLNKQNYTKKVVIAGNHDNIAQKTEPFINPGTSQWEYLCDSGTEFEGLKIWGSPWSLWFDGIHPKCTAFTGSESELSKKYELIPENINILITHSPPFGILDKSIRNGNRCGSKSLSDRISKLKNLKLHVFGHIHEEYGKYLDDKIIGWSHLSINCSHMNENYEAINPSINMIL